MKKYYLLIFYFLLLIGCGTKGRLYIPEREYPQSQLNEYEYEIFTDQKQLA